MELRHSVCALDCRHLFAVVNVEEGVVEQAARRSRSSCNTEVFCAAKSRNTWNSVRFPAELRYPQNARRQQGRRAVPGRIGWNEALDTIAKKLGAIADEVRAVNPFCHKATREPWAFDGNGMGPPEFFPIGWRGAAGSYDLLNC